MSPPLELGSNCDQSRDVARSRGTNETEMFQLVPYGPIRRRDISSREGLMYIDPKWKVHGQCQKVLIETSLTVRFLRIR
jgi:hypothetical protein